MNTQPVKLIDAARALLATAEVVDEGLYFGGTINLESTPPSLRALFDEFEEVVNDQMLSFLDEIQEKISAFGIKVVFADGFEADVKDLQVFPTAGEVSFKLAASPAHAFRPA